MNIFQKVLYLLFVVIVALATWLGAAHYYQRIIDEVSQVKMGACSDGSDKVSIPENPTINQTSTGANSPNISGNGNVVTIH